MGTGGCPYRDLCIPGISGVLWILLVHQQDHRRHRTQARQQQQWRTVDQGGDDDDRTEYIQHHFRQLHIALDRAGPGVFGTGVDIQQGVEQGAEGQHHEQDSEGRGDIAEKHQAGLAEPGHQGQAELDEQRGGHLRQAMEDLVVTQVADPMQGRLATEQLGAMQDQVARHASEHQGDGQQQYQGKAGMQERMLVEGTPEVLDVEPELFDVHGRNGSSI